MSDLFKVVLPSLQLTKKHCFEEYEKEYKPFVVNKMLSYHDDSIFYAAEMNIYHVLPEVAQYNFFFHSLRKKKRGYASWIKPVKPEDLELVKEYFGYSDQKARMALSVLQESELEHIRTVLTIGQ